MQRNRNEFRFSVAAVIVLALFIGHSLFGRVSAQSGSTYEDLEIFSDALSIIQNEYVEDVESSALVYGALQGMMSQLDPHSQFMPPDVYGELKVETEGHFGGLGIVISLDKNKVLTVMSPIPDTPASRAGIIAGDRIIEIDGETSYGLVLEEAVKKLRGPKGSKVTIKVLRLHEDEEDRAPEELEFTLIRDEIRIASVSGEMKESDIGYVRLDEFSERTGRDLEKKLNELTEQGMRSMVLDMRNNPGGLLNVAAEVADKFLSKGELIVYTESRDAEQNMRFKARQKSAIPDDMPIVVLVNGGSASASEIVAGALMDKHRAVIMGEKTFGKGSVQSIIPLSDGSALRLTTAKYLTPNGHSINGVGIEPDIEVKTTAEQKMRLLSGRHGVSVEPDGEDGDSDREDGEIDDPQLQRAIELLQGYDIFKTLKQNINIAKAQEPESEEVASAEEESEVIEIIDAEGDTVIEIDGGLLPSGPLILVPEETEQDSEQAPAEENEK
jgi:carboxyl-terminal processing protease